MSMYKKVSTDMNFVDREKATEVFWKENHIFEKSMDSRKEGETYTFYDGPPTANGKPHIGHVLTRVIKDMIPRYRTMKGYMVPRKAGWDTHGLPVELEVEKLLGLDGKDQIEEYGLEPFIDRCKESVWKYKGMWEDFSGTVGFWADMEHPYVTYDNDFIESEWWALKQIWDKGLLYKGFKIVPYCPRCGTPLSAQEVAQGYKDVKERSAIVRFKVKDEDAYILAWTTTPWTLPSNLGLCVNPEEDYAKVKCVDGNVYYMACALLDTVLGKLAEEEKPAYEVLETYKGKELEYKEYEPLYQCAADAASKQNKKCFYVVCDNYVTLTDGTGVVHIAPAFGEEDNKVFRGTGVPNVEPIDAECKFTKEVPDYQGVFVKDADKDIIARLKNEGKLVKRDTIVHSYPHCWRCNSPLIYRGIGSWFVKVADHHDRLLRANSQITWQPAHIKEGRFGKWLEGSRDWAVSRNRYWGNPIPIWRCDDPDCKHTLCVGSRQELKDLSGTYPEDLHKQFVDKITFTCPKCKKGTMKRIPEVFDCWFESGSMPYAQQHYPFENKEYFEKHFPADFISEGLDQTRGWFYTLTVLAAQLFDKPAFKNCIVNGIVLASDGRKMSKSLRNYTDPVEAINKFGADAIRLFLMHSAVVKADEIRYSDDGVREVLKSIIIPLWNSYSFFVTYANIDGITCTGHAFDNKLPENPLDCWLLSVTQSLVKKVTEAMEQYDLSAAIDPIVDFIDQLNNWYIRRSRRRFWKSENDGDKTEAYETLYTALKTFAKVAAPFVPFITEEMWQNLKIAEDKESVHLEDYPVYNERFHNEKLEFKMNTVQKAISMGRSLRNQFNLKNRQPLASVALVTRNSEEKTVLAEMLDSIKEELNVKNVIFHEREDELVEYKAKANFKVLGKELGALMKDAASKIIALEQSAIQSILDGSKLTIEVGDKTVDLTEEKIIVDRIEKEDVKVINEGTLTVGLDTKITDELKKEGYVRDLVRGIQNLRKDSGFEVTDRIKLTVGGDAELKAAFEIFADFIKSETLAVEAAWVDSIDGATSVEADDKTWSIKVEKK